MTTETPRVIKSEDGDVELHWSTFVVTIASPSGARIVRSAVGLSSVVYESSNTRTTTNTNKAHTFT